MERKAWSGTERGKPWKGEAGLEQTEISHRNGRLKGKRQRSQTRKFKPRWRTDRGKALKGEPGQEQTQKTWKVEPGWGTDRGKTWKLEPEGEQT